MCSTVVGPSISGNKVVTGTRYQAYHNEFYVEDEWGNKELKKVDSVGTEITGEQLVCNQCAGVEGEAKQLSIPFAKWGFQEEPADSLHVKLAAVMGYNALDRLGHKSPRAKRDVAVSIPILKQFVDLNKDFTF